MASGRRSALHATEESRTDEPPAARANCSVPCGWTSRSRDGRDRAPVAAAPSSSVPVLAGRLSLPDVRPPREAPQPLVAATSVLSPASAVAT